MKGHLGDSGRKVEGQSSKEGGRGISGSHSSTKAKEEAEEGEGEILGFFV